MRLAGKLHHTLAVLDPSLLIILQDENRLTQYLDNFLALPGDPEEALCAALSPERYDYIALVFEQEFEADYLTFLNCGILTYELINMVAVCAAAFDATDFPKNEDSRMLRYSIIGTIDEYLKGDIEDGL